MALPALPPSAQYPFESLFRSQHYALLDNSCREYLFLCDFFLVAGTPALDLFNTVMGKTLTLFLVSVCVCVGGWLGRDSSLSRGLKPRLSFADKELKK